MTAGSETERLAAVAEYEVIDMPPGEEIIATLSALCELAAEISGSPQAVVNIIDDRFQHQVAAWGADPQQCQRDESLCATTLAGGVDLFVADAASDPRFAGSPWVDGRLGSIRMYCATILRNPAGLALGTLCVFDRRARDLSATQQRSLKILAQQVVGEFELRLRTRTLQRSHVELVASQDRLATFAGQISHDLKAPITAIIGFTELLSELETIEDDPSAAGYVARCSSSAKRMLAMIDDLLAFAKVGGSLTAVSIDLDRVMPGIVDDLRAAAANATVTWDGPPVLGDEAQLRALLQNLVGNAIAYRREGVDPVIAVTTRRMDDSIVLSIVDNGCGIPPERRGDVVLPLFRLRKDIPGAGLGLAVAVRVAAAHGGTLEIGDGPDGPESGTTMTIVLPQPAG